MKQPLKSLFDIGVAADMCVDLVLAGNVRPQFHQVEQLIADYSLEIGGSANIFACQLAKLGARVAVMGRVGADLFGKYLQERLLATGVDISHVQSDSRIRTGLGVTLTEPDDRAILTFLGSIDGLGPGDLPSSPARLASHWHVASFFLLQRLRPAWRTFLEDCRRAGLTLSFDPNWDPEERWEGVTELLPLTDVFLPNEAEALAITGASDALAAGRILSGFGPLVVIKRGERGVLAVERDSQWAFEPAPAEQVVDTVGAGDNFDAGFLSGWLSGLDVQKSIELGHRCAISSLAQAGGIAGQLQEPHFIGRHGGPGGSEGTPRKPEAEGREVIG